MQSKRASQKGDANVSALVEHALEQHEWINWEEAEALDSNLSWYPMQDAWLSPGTSTKSLA